MVFYLFRVDDRLIHGQVVEGWARPLRIDTIFVVNDSIAEDSTQKLIFEFAVPPEINTVFCRIDSLQSTLTAVQNANSRIMFLFSNIDDVYKLVMRGFIINELNLGGLRSSEGTIKLSQAVFVNKRDIDILKSLLRKRININIQSVPGEKLKHLKDIIK